MFLTIPAMVGYLGLGFLIVGALFRRGAFGLADNWLVYVVLGGYSLGLIATTLSRLLQNAFYALQDTKTPAKVAVFRVALSALVAVPLMVVLDRYAVADVLAVASGDAPLRFGAAGLALGASAGAWVELWRLCAALRRRIDGFGLPWGRLARMLGLAATALVPAALAWWALPPWPVALLALLVVGLYGGTYLALSYRAGIPEMTAWIGRFLHRSSP
jgi:putative peptidoglycan lipid II flippase